MKPKLTPNLEKYFTNIKMYKPKLDWYNYGCEITANNLYFCFFIVIFILFLCYRYYMKNNTNNSK